MVFSERMQTHGQTCWWGGCNAATVGWAETGRRTGTTVAGHGPRPRALRGIVFLGPPGNASKYQPTWSGIEAAVC